MVRIVVTISTYVQFLYVLVELRFQATAQIVADRNLEILNGSDVLWILQISERFDVFCFDARKLKTQTRNWNARKLNAQTWN